jgi:hypothetical protein
MPHMTVVSAGEFGDPITVFVGMKAGNATLSRSRMTRFIHADKIMTARCD